jgi:hypothetical protein
MTRPNEGTIDEFAPIVPVMRDIFRLVNRRHPKPKIVTKRRDALICRDLTLDLPFLADLTINGVAGGVYYGDNITLTGNNKLSESLIVVAQHDLVVSGATNISAYGGLTQYLPTNPQIEITLVSLKGDVTIEAGALITSTYPAPPGLARDASATQAVAVGSPGLNAMRISISGENVTIEGSIRGISGGDGGSCEAIGVPDPITQQGGSAIAVSGPGGFGGDVLITACKSIVVGEDSMIDAGFGGSAGRAGPPIPAAAPGGARAHDQAYAQADNSQTAIALGADGGPGGDVIFVGFGRTACRVKIRAGAWVSGGTGGMGGKATAKAGGGKAVGGSGYARAGNADVGGTVRFIRCEVQSRGVVKAGDGGLGGTAQADGGIGESTNAGGKDGGPGWAHGGDGGPSGNRPAYENEQGQTQNGVGGAFGSGGEAEATGGAGGDDLAGGGTGGKSGVGLSQGGSDGNGNLATPKAQPTQDPNGEKGGVGVTASSDGKAP